MSAARLLNWWIMGEKAAIHGTPISAGVTIRF
jgi:hypothetical protein